MPAGRRGAGGAAVRLRGGGVKGEWKNAETGMRIVFQGGGTGTLYTPMFGAELENELTYDVDGDQLTIVLSTRTEPNRTKPS